VMMMISAARTASAILAAALSPAATALGALRTAGHAGHRVSGPHQVDSHWAPHDAEPNEADQSGRTSKTAGP
jgi:heme A synthase